MSDLQPLYDQVDQLCEDRIARNARIRELEALLRASEHTGVACAANVQRLEAELRDTKDTLEAVKHSNRELEAEVEKLQDELALSRHYRDDLSAENEKLRVERRGWQKRSEKAEAERDRLAESVQAERAKQAPVIGSLHATSRELVTVKTQRDRLLDQALTDRGYRQELEAEVEKLREEMRAVEDGHRCQYRSRMETAEAELDRLAITLKAVQRIADDASLWGIESIARAALEGRE